MGRRSGRIGPGTSALPTTWRRRWGRACAARRSDYYFDGGDIDADGETAFVSPRILPRNVQHTAATREDFIKGLEAQLQRRVVMLDGAPEHHVGMYLMPVGDRTVLVGDPGLAQQCWPGPPKKPPRSPPSCPAARTSRRPRLPTSIRSPSCAGRPAIASFAFPSSPACDGRTFVTYVNAIIDVRDGRDMVYMPSYTFRGRPERGGDGGMERSGLRGEAGPVRRLCAEVRDAALPRQRPATGLIHRMSRKTPKCKERGGVTPPLPALASLRDILFHPMRRLFVRKQLPTLGVWMIGVTALAADRQPDDVYAANTRLGRGINLGNALEAPKEGDWGVTLKAEYFKAIKEAGFDTVRLPVQLVRPRRGRGPVYDRAEVRRAGGLGHRSGPGQQAQRHRQRPPLRRNERRPGRHLPRLVGAVGADRRPLQGPARRASYFELLNEPHDKLSEAKWNAAMPACSRRCARPTRPGRSSSVPGQWNGIGTLDNWNCRRTTTT